MGVSAGGSREEKQNDVKPPRKRTQALVERITQGEAPRILREGAKKPKCQGEYEQAIEADSRSERAGLNTNGLPRQCAGRPWLQEGNNGAECWSSSTA